MKILLLTLLTIVSTASNATPTTFSKVVHYEEISKIKFAFLEKDMVCKKLATEKTWFGNRVNSNKFAICQVTRTFNVMNAVAKLRLRDLKFREEQGYNYVSLSATRILMKPSLEIREDLRILLNRLNAADAQEFQQILRGPYQELMSEEKMVDIENEIRLLI